MSVIEKLKKRWGIQSTWQVIIILIVFSCTGLTAVYVKRFLFGFFGITGEEPFWLRTILWLVTVLPLYHFFLVLYGAIFGQFDFFWNFTKKMIGRFIPGMNSKVKESEA